MNGWQWPSWCAPPQKSFNNLQKSSRFHNWFKTDISWSILLQYSLSQSIAAASSWLNFVSLLVSPLCCLSPSSTTWFYFHFISAPCCLWISPSAAAHSWFIPAPALLCGMPIFGYISLFLVNAINWFPLFSTLPVFYKLIANQLGLKSGVLCAPWRALWRFGLCIVSLVGTFGLR